MLKISRAEAVKMIEELTFGSNGVIFTVEFVKRTNGEYRVMNCRGGVQKGVKGVGLAFDPREKGLFVVYDMQKLDERFLQTRLLLDPSDTVAKGAFRMINEEGLQVIKARGEEYEVVGELEDADEEDTRAQKRVQGIEDERVFGGYTN